MTSIVGTKPQQIFKKSLFTVDAGVQTETSSDGIVDAPQTVKHNRIDPPGLEPSPSASDLASILKWSTDISSDINLSSGDYSIINIDL